MKVNASGAIPPENLGEAIQEALISWTEEKEKEFFKVIDKAADKCNDAAASYLSKGNGVDTGDYKNSFRVNSERLSKHHHKSTWYVDAPEYRLIHLLENGHATRNGGRTKAIKHVVHGREIAEQVLDGSIQKIWQG